MEVILLSYLGAGSATPARQACRRLHRAAPGVKIGLGFWNEQLRDRSGTSPPCAFTATSFVDAVDKIRALCEQRPSVASSSTAAAESGSARACRDA